MAFSDDASIDRPELLRRALEYHQKLGTPVFSEAHDPAFQPEGLMHEGAASTRLGLPGCLRKGKPCASAGTSTSCATPVADSTSRWSPVPRACNPIRDAKAEGLPVTCGTTVHHLCWTDEDLDGFNRDLKLPLPLRSADDRTALRTAALDGTLDAVVSDHRPRTPEEHDADFMVVAPGIAGLHAVGPALFGALRDHGASTEAVGMEAMARLLASGPRRVLGFPIGWRRLHPFSARRTKR